MTKHRKPSPGMKVQCPSVLPGVSELTHEPCTRCSAWWVNDKCSVPNTIPVGSLTKKLRCSIAHACRWMQQSVDGLCPPMRLGEVCEHQGGTFNIFMMEEASE